MQFGIKKKEDKVLCLNCNAVVGEREVLVNFCPKCGNPLNMDAVTSREEEYVQVKAKLLYDIIDEVEQGEDAVEIIKDYLKD